MLCLDNYTDNYNFCNALIRLSLLNSNLNNRFSLPRAELTKVKLRMFHFLKSDRIESNRILTFSVFLRVRFDSNILFKLNDIKTEKTSKY